MQRIILHIDFDSFFASVEQQHNPRFRNKPIGVTATNGRTCIIAASREAKKYGIKTGTRSWEAFQLCPSLQLVPADFVKYFEISKKFLSITKDFSPFVEMFSLDEVFIDVTKTAHLFGGVYSLISKVKQRIQKEIGEYITVSVGISHNKLLAKLASGLKKPNGVMEIKEQDIECVFQNAKLTDICGIGERIKIRLNKIGVYSLLQLRETHITRLIQEFGTIEGRFLKNVGLGIDESSVIPYTQAPTVKSVGRNYCLPKNEYDQRVVLQNVYELCEEVALKLRRLGKKAKIVGLSLRGSFTISGCTTLALYTDDGTDIFKTCLAIIKNCHSESRQRLTKNPIDYIRSFVYTQDDRGQYIRQISVWVSRLEDDVNIPLSLFENTKKSSLQSTIDSLNDKFGDHTIRNGFLLYAPKLTTVPNGWGADRYDRMRLAAEQGLY